VSLVHHVQLNESGWWKKAVSQIIKGVLWSNQSAMSVVEVKEQMFGMLQIRVSEDVLESQLNFLKTQGSVFFESGKYRLAEASRRDLTTSNKAAKVEQAECKESFTASCVELCPDLDPEQAWIEFSQALIRSIRISGANLYHLIRDGNLRKNIDWMTELRKRHGPEHEKGLMAVAERFFAPENQVCRSQVLRFLTAHFFAEATQFTPETITAIEKGTKPRIIKVVLDTNFIFSVLGLHENPADDAAKSLLDLAASSKGKLDVKLYVLPSTIDEARRVISHQVGAIEAIRPSRAIAAAATGQPLSSIAKKFFEHARKVSGLRASEFFQPYIDDLKAILGSHGILVLESQREYFHQRQDVLDDVAVEMEAESGRPENKRKSYEALLHDAVLWHVVADRRVVPPDSPFDVQYWGVSIDWRLISFDKKKRAKNGGKVPVILHPESLVQLLQFWVPRTSLLEETLIDTIKLPLFFQSFDVEDERATLKVLEQLSRYEKIDDLPETVLRQILANKILRTRITQVEASNDGEALELVRDELIAIHTEQAESLYRTKGELVTVSAELQDAQASYDDAKGQLSNSESKYQSEVEKTQVLGDALTGEARLRGIAEMKLAKAIYLIYFVLMPTFFAALFAIGSYIASVYGFPGLITGWKIYTLLVVPAFLIPYAISWMMMDRFLNANTNLDGWWPARLGLLGSKAWKWILGLVLTSIGTSYIEAIGRLMSGES
jgi:hypothetical protein